MTEIDAVTQAQLHLGYASLLSTPYNALQIDAYDSFLYTINIACIIATTATVLLILTLISVS